MNRRNNTRTQMRNNVREAHNIRTQVRSRLQSGRARQSARDQARHRAETLEETLEHSHRPSNRSPQPPGGRNGSGSSGSGGNRAPAGGSNGAGPSGNGAPPIQPGNVIILEGIHRYGQMENFVQASGSRRIPPGGEKAFHMAIKFFFTLLGVPDQFNWQSGSLRQSAARAMLKEMAPYFVEEPKVKIYGGVYPGINPAFFPVAALSTSRELIASLAPDGLIGPYEYEGLRKSLVDYWHVEQMRRQDAADGIMRGMNGKIIPNPRGCVEVKGPAAPSWMKIVEG